MNTYYFTFPFKDEHCFITLTANQLANSLLYHHDDVLDFCCNNGEENKINHSFIGPDGRKYETEFRTSKLLNIYYGEGEGDDEGYLVEKDVPYMLLKIKDKNGKELYNLTDNI